MNSDFRQAAGSKKGGPVSSQPSSLRDKQGETELIKSEIEKKIGPIVEEKVKSGIEEEVKEKGVDKILLNQRSKEDRINQIKKEAEDRVQEQSSKRHISYSPAYYGTDKMHDPNLSDEENKARKTEAIRAEMRDEAQRETKKAMKDVQSMKGKMALKLTGNYMDNLAYAIASKMATEANRGGIHAFLPILITYILAYGKDLFDYSGVGAIVGLLTGILCGGIIALFWVQVSGGWKGGYIQRKLIKRIIIKIGLAALIETLPGPNLIPTFIIMNLWSHLDWAKDIKNSKARFETFTSEYPHTRKINKNIAEQYLAK